MKDFLSALLNDFITVLPIVIQAIRNVHKAAPDLPAETQKAVVTQTIAAAATQTGTPLTDEQTKVVSDVHDIVVTTLKTAGELKPAAPPVA